MTFSLRPQMLTIFKNKSENGQNLSNGDDGESGDSCRGVFVYGEERGRGQRGEGAGLTGASGEEEVGQSYR